MTAITYTCREPGLRWSWLVLFLATIAAVAALAFWPRHTTVATIRPIPPVVYEKHAVARHDAEAEALRRCLNEKKGAEEIWMSRDKKTFYLLCTLPDGRLGFMAIVQDFIDKLWYEKTSFVPDEPTRVYLARIATKFNGPYPWAP